MAHASTDDLKTYLGIDSTTDDTLLGSLLTRASDAIDRYCGRRFVAESETRYFEDDALDPDGVTLYLDDDLCSVTTITNGDSDSTSIATTEYFLMPRHGGPPYYAIRMKSSSTYQWEVDEDDWIEIAGYWGWADTTAPDDIIHAAIRLAAYYYHQKDSATYDVQAFPEAGMMTIPKGMPEDVKIVLGPYRKVVW